MARPTLSRVVFLACAALPIATRAEAQEGDAAAAQALFDDARHLEDAGQLERACPKFLASYKLDPKPGTVLNLADCYEKTGRTASAWARYLETAALASRQPDQAEREKYAREHAALLAPKLSHLSVSVAEPLSGMRVVRDGNVLDAAAVGSPIPVDPGTHTVDASAPGKKPWSKTVVIANDGATESVEVPALEDVKSSQGATGDAHASRLGTQRTVAIVVAGAGTVAAVVGAVFGWKAQSTWADARDSHCQGTVCDADGVTMNHDAKSAATASTISFVAAAALLGGGAVLWFTAPSSTTRERVGMTVVPTVTPSAASVSILGVF